MKAKVFLILGCCFFLCSCTKVQPPTPMDSDHDATVTLSEAAASVSQSLDELGATEQAAYPPESVSTPPSPTSYGMGMKASIDWNGPVEPIVQQIANATNYKFHVLGNEPSIPVIISLHERNEAMGNILRNIGYQAKKRAAITVFPSTRVIELSYEPT